MTDFRTTRITTLALLCIALILAPLANLASAQPKPTTTPPVILLTADGQSTPWWKVGRWYWMPEKSKATRQHVLFRKRIELKEKPAATATATTPGHAATIPLAISADAVYRLHVNGRMVTQGPARSLRDHATVDELDLAPWLHAGANEVAVEVGYRPGARWDAGYICQSPGLFFAVDLSKSAGATESAWRCLEPRAYDDDAPLGNRGASIEVFDARRIDAAWKTAAYDDSKWAEAADLGPAGMPPRTQMQSRDVPLPEMNVVKAERIIGFERGDGSTAAQPGDGLPSDPKSLMADLENGNRLPAVVPEASLAWPIELPGGQHDVTVDFGRPYVGFLGIDIEGEAGSVVDIAWHEVLGPDGSVRPNINLPLHQISRYTLRAGRQQFMLMCANTVRYVRVMNRTGPPVKLHAVMLKTYVAPHPTGSFTCSDETLNRVFEAARTTANNCVVDLYMDNPERERNGWFHDGYWSCFTYTLLSADPSVLRRECRMGAVSFIGAGKAELVSPFVPIDGGEVIPGHSLFWLLQAKLDSDLSGTNDFGPQIAPGIDRLMKNFAVFENKEGLLEKVPGWNWLDWSNIRMDGAVVPLNALYSRALDDAAAMTGKKEYAAKAKAIRETLCRLCPGTLFPDCLVREGDKLAPVPQHAEGTQCFALWCGVPDAERERALWQLMREGKFAGAGTYTHMQRLHYAATHGDIETFISDVRKVYGFQVDHGPGTLSETLGGGPSYCQGVASGVGACLMQGVLGVRPIEGYQYVRIEPGVAGDVSWCRGTLPTKLGAMGVSWMIKHDDFQLLVSLPKGAKARVILPPVACRIWGNKPTDKPWSAAIEIDRSTRFVVTPGSVLTSN